MNAFQLITFDLDNTLWETPPVLVKAEQALFNWVKEHHPAASKHYNVTTIQKIRTELITAHPSLKHRLTDLRKQTLFAFFKSTGYPEKKALACANASFEVFYAARNNVTYYPGALKCLHRLAEKYPLGALSNGNANIEKVGLKEVMAFHFNAENSDHPKPHSAMFKRALATQNYPPNQCLHIGDHPTEDIRAAQALGMRTIWINFEEKPWPLDQPPCAQLNHWQDCESIISRLENGGESTLQNN